MAKKEAARVEVPKELQVGPGCMSDERLDVILCEVIELKEWVKRMVRKGRAG